jgi:hypothetical protein
MIVSKIFERLQNAKLRLVKQICKKWGSPEADPGGFESR